MYISPPFLSSAHLLEEHEKEVESERQRTAPVPRRASLVDTTLLSSVYGLGGPATNRFEDDTPSQSEDILSPRPEGGDSWGASDTDDDLDPPRQTVSVVLYGSNCHCLILFVLSCLY